MNSIRAAALVALALGGCNLSNQGFDAPRGELAYPIAMALSQPTEDGGAPAHLYVANSNFDLRYNGGSVQVYDLAALQRALEERECTAPIVEDEEEPPVDPELDGGTDAEADDAGLDDAGLDDAELPSDAGGELADGEVLEGGAEDAGEDARIAPQTFDAALGMSRGGSRPRLCDGRGDSDPETDRCCFTKRTQLDALRLDEMSVDSYASGIALSPDGAHLYVPLRSQSRLLHVDVDEAGQLSCGDEKGRCRRGPSDGANAEIDDLELPALPTAVLTGRLADLGVSGRGTYFVATAHEQGHVSLFGVNGDGAPRLFYTLAPPNRTAERAGALRLDDGFFLVASAAGSSVMRIGARTDLPANEDRERPGVYLYQSASLRFDALVFTQDVRDVLPDSREPAPGEPRRYYALLRGSSTTLTQSVGFLELSTSSSDGSYARAVDAVRVGAGLSKLLQADVGQRHLLFVSCYQDGEIHVLDADARRTVTVMRDVLGPSDMQIDVPRRLLYVTDFRASVIRVIDLHGLFDGTGGVPRVVATLGAPYLPGNVR